MAGIYSCTFTSATTEFPIVLKVKMVDHAMSAVMLEKVFLFYLINYCVLCLLPVSPKTQAGEEISWKQMWNAVVLCFVVA